MPKPTTDTVDAEVIGVGAGEIRLRRWGTCFTLTASRDMERSASSFLYKTARLTVEVERPTKRGTVVAVCEVPNQEGT